MARGAECAGACRKHQADRHDLAGSQALTQNDEARRRRDGGLQAHQYAEGRLGQAAKCFELERIRNRGA